MVGVDLPLLETEFLDWMVRHIETTGAMATIPALLGEPQPLCAVYRRELLWRTYGSAGGWRLQGDGCGGERPSSGGTIDPV